MLFTDTGANILYRIDVNFTAGDAFSCGVGTLLKLNTSTGILTPAVFGLNNPHGMLFVTP